jgi:hypothetical protein
MFIMASKGKDLAEPTEKINGKTNGFLCEERLCLNSIL